MNSEPIRDLSGRRHPDKMGEEDSVFSSLGGLVADGKSSEERKVEEFKNGMRDSVLDFIEKVFEVDDLNEINREVFLKTIDTIFYESKDWELVTRKGNLKSIKPQ